MLAMDVETQKIEPDPNYFIFYDRRKVCKYDWHEVKLYLFFNVQNFQIIISVYGLQKCYPPPK